MSDPELMTGLNYELLFLESLKLVVRPNHPLLQENVTLSRVLQWPVVVSPEGTAPRQHSEALVQSQGCKIPSGCIETLSASLSRQLTVDYDYVWFVPSGAVKMIYGMPRWWRCLFRDMERANRLGSLLALMRRSPPVVSYSLTLFVNRCPSKRKRDLSILVHIITPLPKPS